MAMDWHYNQWLGQGRDQRGHRADFFFLDCMDIWMNDQSYWKLSNLNISHEALPFHLRHRTYCRIQQHNALENVAHQEHIRHDAWSYVYMDGNRSSD